MMQRWSSLILAASALLATGCQIYDWFRYRELRAVRDSLEAIDGVVSVEAGGNEDVTLEDIWAKIRLRTGGELWLFQLTSRSFSGTSPVVVGKAGDLFPKFSAHRSWGIAAEFGGGGLFAGQLSRPILNAGEAVARYEEISAALQSWPRCPEFATLADPNGGEVRYCTQVGSSDGWWP
jgi:hypothetical protein